MLYNFCRKKTPNISSFSLMICKMSSTGYNFLLFIFTVCQSATTLKPLTADDKKIDHFTTLWVVWMNTKGLSDTERTVENSYWTNAKTIHLHILTYKLTCHCKLLLQLRRLQESLLQLAGHNDTLHSLPVMRRSKTERDGGQQERLGVGVTRERFDKGEGHNGRRGGKKHRQE